VACSLERQIVERQTRKWRGVKEREGRKRYGKTTVRNNLDRISNVEVARRMKAFAFLQDYCKTIEKWCMLVMCFDELSVSVRSLYTGR